MNEPVPISDFIHPVCLPDSWEPDVDRHRDDLVTVSGWGKEHLEAPETSNVLKTVNIKIYAQKYVPYVRLAIISHD